MAEDRNIFDEFSRPHADCAEAVQRQEKDLREAMRLLMTRREGRILLNWLLEGQDPRALMRRVMTYVEDTYV